MGRVKGKLVRNPQVQGVPRNSLAVPAGRPPSIVTVASSVCCLAATGAEPQKHVQQQLAVGLPL